LIIDYIFKYTHLDDEVEHIHASKLKEANFAEQDVIAVVADLEKYAKGHGDPFVIVPYMRRSALAKLRLAVTYIIPHSPATHLPNSRIPGQPCRGFCEKP
jgi:hypothetical protein